MMWLFKDSVEYLQKWMKGQDTKPTTSAIMFWYIKRKGWKVCQDAPHLPIELSSASK